ncbi:endospore germination permease [Brevibacillus composti]|uniref:Endospore germination permease n=1 Tax=Brevibacillus composti TaxID=2796470 RepID=A0A7T5JQ81_9BACL|nr:endospore germination permease [Brevibacillus composti]QQE76064.1 endospore germination permease [Brevibacillus composti]QUO43092.1 endospore germination permease [Brevibacillus composti]
MQAKQVINHRQIAWITGGILMTSSLVSLPQPLAVIAKNDAWLSQLLPVCYAILVAYVFERLIRAYPRKNLFEIIVETMGRYLGGIINGALLLYLLAVLVRDVKGVGHFLKLSLLRDTPLEIILLVFVLVLLYFGRTSLEIPARVNEMYFPLYFSLSFVMYFILANEYNLQRIEPVLESKLTALLLSNWMASGMYGDIFIWAAFLHTISQSRLYFSSVKHGAIMAGFSIMLIIVIQLGVLGYIITSRLNFPVYVLVQQIHLTDFLERVEVILFSIWFPAFTIKVVITYMAVLIGLGSVVGKENYNELNAPLCWLVLTVSLIAFPHLRDVVSFIGYLLPILVTVLQWPVLLFLFFHAHKKVKQRTGTQEGDHPLIRRFRLYCRLGWVAIGICAVSVTAGSFLEPHNGTWGLALGVVFFFSFLAALIFSYLEMQSLNHIVTIAKQLSHESQRGNATESS